MRNSPEVRISPWLTDENVIEISQELIHDKTKRRTMLVMTVSTEEARRLAADLIKVANELDKDL